MKKLYRAINDVDLEKLTEFYKSPNEQHSFGVGMYFSYTYDFAKIFAQSLAVQKVGLIGEYVINLPEDTLSFEVQDNTIVVCSHENYKKLHDKYKEDPITYRKHLRDDYKNYSAIDHVGREVCLKKETPLELVSISLILMEKSATDLFKYLKEGEVISDQEIRNLSPLSIPKINKWLKEDT